VKAKAAALALGAWLAPASVVLAAPVDAAAPDAAGADAATEAADAGAPDGAPGDASPDTGAREAAAVGRGARPAETARLEGRVFARGSRRPVAGALIVVDVAEAGATDRAGRFAVEVTCGRHQIATQAPGFEPLAVMRDACADGAPLVLRLPPREGIAGYETVVRATSSRQSVRLEQDELTHTPGTLGDPFRAVESLPGVASVAWPAPIYAVRGSNPGNTGYFLDDVRVPALFHFALGPSVIHPYFFESLDFYPGGYPARYGRYVAGVVSAHTRVAPDDDVHASVDVRLYDAGAMVTAPLPGQGSVAVAARYSYTGAVVGWLSDGVSLDYWDYQLRADRAFGRVRLTLLAFGSNDALATRTTTLALRFHRVKVRAETAVAGGSLAATLGLGADRSQAPIVDDVPVTLSALSALPRLVFTRAFGRADVEAGFDGEIERFDPETTLERLGALDLGKRRTARLLAGYASVNVRAAERLLVTPELRYDSYAEGGVERADLGPRLSARLALDASTWVRVSGGRFTQTPSLPLQLPGAESFGLALYGLQSSWQGALAVGTTRVRGLEATVTGYVQRYVLTDLRNPVITRSVDPLADDFLVARDALSYGVEVLVRRPATERLSGWISYTLSQNERSLGGGVVGPSDWDQRHVLNLVLGYRWRRYTFGGRAHFNTGRPVLVSGASGETFERLPAYYQLDLRCDRRFVFDKLTLDAYVEVVNATINRQVVGLVQPSPDLPPTQDAYSIVLPSIGVHGEF
jgi:TonB-dependent Receptor Plug Domain